MTDPGPQKQPASIRQIAAQVKQVRNQMSDYDHGRTAATERLVGVRGDAAGDSGSGWLEFGFSTGRTVRFDGLNINFESLRVAGELIGFEASADDLLAVIKKMTPS
jgi:hypothetical protein